MRRAVQTICFLAYFVLFLYVCWPYTARPAVSWPGWVPEAVDGRLGEVTLAADQAVNAAFHRRMRLHLSEPRGDSSTYFGTFEVLEVDSQHMKLRPAGSLSREQLDALAASVGPWTLADRKPGDWPSHYADTLTTKEKIAAETFLILDPLVSLSTAVAARSWVWSLAAAAAILVVCLAIPRGFCGYLCPLGTLIDLFDAVVGKWLRRFRLRGEGWWVNLKYYLLAAVLCGSLCGVLLSGYVAAIPVLTRGAAFTLTPLALGLSRDWHQVPSLNAGQYVSLALFLLVLGLGLFRPRFWCKYVCPSGAVFSLGNLLRTTQRSVLTSCIDCGKCVEVCPFDAIESDFATRTLDCTFCQTCGGVCPVQAIQFTDRWTSTDLKPAADRAARRGFLVTAAGAVAGALGGAGLAAGTRLLGADASDESNAVVRPPGSVPEKEFLQLCIRCGVCFQACPNSVLQPMGLERGLDTLWTPQVVANWSGCEPSCSNCGQVCPTGAIRALVLVEKRVARMGLAVVNRQTCLPFAGREACELCVVECKTAGYDAIEFMRVGGARDPFVADDNSGGWLAPVVLADKCVGCGLCQTRCHQINVKTKHLLAESAILVRAGEGNEDRLHAGSYRELRKSEQQRRQKSQRQRTEQSGAGGSYLPDFLK